MALLGLLHLRGVRPNAVRLLFPLCPRLRLLHRWLPGADPVDPGGVGDEDPVGAAAGGRAEQPDDDKHGDPQLEQGGRNQSGLAAEREGHLGVMRVTITEANYFMNRKCYI